MKYLKLFENFDDDYFRLIGSEELQKQHYFSRLVNLDDGEFEKIKGLFPSGYNVSEEKWKGSVSFVEAIRTAINPITRKYMYLGIIKIWKMKDEWYLVSTSDIKDRGRILQMCDQFEGLKRLLEKSLVK